MKWYRDKVREFCRGKRKKNGRKEQICKVTNLFKETRTEKFLLESASDETVAGGQHGVKRGFWSDLKGG